MESNQIYITVTLSASDNILLITGSPGIGKTTVIKKVIQGFPELPKAGFYTEEIRVNNVRLGFDLITLQNERFTMAHTSIRSGHRVGKYGVAVDTIDKAVAATLNAEDAPEFYIIDEIGKMECFSTMFVQRISALLDSGKPVVATIALKGGGFIAAAKKSPGTKLWEVTKKNRNEIPKKISAWLKDRLPG